jgi:hypothetical protein
MNRREFGRTALGVAATTLIAPAAMAAQPRTIRDCIVIDYDQSKKKWRNLPKPDSKGRKFVYDESSKTAKFRHFEFLGSDGLVLGVSTPMQLWAACYDQFEQDFISFYTPPSGKKFTHSEFLRYAEDVRYYFNGHVVEISDLA